MQFSMSVSSSGIRSDFLNPAHYKATLEFASKRNQNYLRFCKAIQKYYMDFQSMTKLGNERIKLQSGSNLQTIAQLKQFAADFMSMIDEVSRFKIQFYSELEEVEQDPVKKPTYEILNSISKYSEAQNKYKDIYSKLVSVEKQLQESFALLKKDTKEAVNYFDAKQTTAKCSKLQELIKNRHDLEKEGNAVLDSIYKNSEQFEKELMFYRQKMLSGKYKVRQKLREMSRGAKECLLQTVLGLLDLAYEKRSAFQRLLRQSIRQSSLYLKFKKRFPGANSEQKLTEMIIQATQQYKMMIDELIDVIKALSECFEMLGTISKENHENSRQIIQQLNKLYENQQNPTPQIIQALDLFYFFCQKMADIPSRIHILEANLGKIKQNISKHSQITLTMVRFGNLNRSKTEQKGVDEIGHLFQQLSYDYINDIINKIYKEFQSILSNMKNHFNEKFYKKTKKVVQDSMEVSHIEEITPFVQKKPSKKEMWIWKDFRNAEKYTKISSETQLMKQIKKDLNSFKELKCDNGKQIEKYSCNIRYKKELKGILSINEKSLTFTAANNTIDVVIPYDFIQEVIAVVNIFQKQLTVKTSMGDIVFLHFPEISRAEVLIQQQTTAQSSSKQGVAKVSLELPPQEKAFLAERRPKVQDQRIAISDMQQIGSLLLQNATTDAVYETLYSDKPFKYKGKEECCFQAYCLKKTGGSNYKTTQYNPPGPKFYSGQQGATFINTPLFSQRTNEYQVPLPPIPFMPKTCTNTQQVKIFWLSNEQFDYTFRCDSRGAPMSDSFYLSFVHRVAQKDKNVQIKIYYKLTFVKEPSMKGMIISKSDEQSKINIGIFINQAKKIMVSGGSGGKTEKAEEGANPAGNEDNNGSRMSRSGSMSKGKMKKLQNQNKVLIGVLVAVIIVNILLKYF